MKKTTFLLMSVVALFVVALTSCDFLDSEKQLVGTWTVSYNEDNCVTTNTYTFNSDGTFKEVIESEFVNGTLKSVAEGTWRVKNEVIEFEYNLDKTKGYVNGEEDEEVTADLVSTNRKENAMTTEYRDRNSVYGFTIVKVNDKKLLVKTGDKDSELELTKK